MFTHQFLIDKHSTIFNIEFHWQTIQLAFIFQSANRRWVHIVMNGL